MKRIRHLEQCSYIIPIGQKINQVLTLSNVFNCYLQRPWDKSLTDYEVQLHAKFNSDIIDGFKIRASLLKNGESVSCLISSFNIYITNNDTYVTTFIGSVPAVTNGLGFEANVDQTFLGSNETTGAETYFIECEVLRKRTKYKKSIYFNHIGVFDSIFRLRNQVQFLDLTKVDE